MNPFWGRRTRGVSLGRGVDEADVPAVKVLNYNANSLWPVQWRVYTQCRNAWPGTTMGCQIVM